MDRVYKRINWNTTSYNGNMDSDRYLHTQIARAICRAAYDKPLTMEEISVSTGIPAMYIEDEHPRLEYGDAVARTGSRYAANFIIFSIQNRKEGGDAPTLLAGRLADNFELLLQCGAGSVRGFDFYGHDFGTDRLGYLLVPYLLREKIRTIKEGRLRLENGLYPPRKDGGYWLVHCRRNCW